MRQIESIVWTAVGLILAMFLSSGCMIGPLAAGQLTPDQIDALKKYNDGNVYACGIVDGGARNGTLVFLLLPKDAKLNVQFNADCHIK